MTFDRRWSREGHGHGHGHVLPNRGGCHSCHRLLAESSSGLHVLHASDATIHARIRLFIRLYSVVPFFVVKSRLFLSRASHIPRSPLHLSLPFPTMAVDLQHLRSIYVALRLSAVCTPMLPYQPGMAEVYARSRVSYGVCSAKPHKTRQIRPRRRRYAVT
jgi:hypothetical protein